MRRAQVSEAMSGEAIERAMSQLRKLVADRGLRNSTVREHVARLALQKPGHFSAEELRVDLESDHKGRAHGATVYRVLPLMIEAGLLRETLKSKGGTAYYERVFERRHHDHLICTSCWKVIEFEFEAIEVLQRDVAAKFGFQLEDHVHELLGTCRECRVRTKKE